MADIVEERNLETKKRLDSIVSQVEQYMLKDIEVYAPRNISTYGKSNWIKGEIERISDLVIEKIEKSDSEKGGQ